MSDLTAACGIMDVYSWVLIKKFLSPFPLSVYLNFFRLQVTFFCSRPCLLLDILPNQGCPINNLYLIYFLHFFIVSPLYPKLSLRDRRSLRQFVFFIIHWSSSPQVDSRMWYLCVEKSLIFFIIHFHIIRVRRCIINALLFVLYEGTNSVKNQFRKVSVLELLTKAINLWLSEAI